MTMVRINTNSPIFWLVTGISLGIGALTATLSESFVYGAIVGVVTYVAMGAMHYKGWRDAHHGHIDTCEEHSKRMLELVSGDKPAAASITKAEQNVVDNLMQALEDFEALGEEHDGEHEAFENLIHGSVAMVFARVGMRSSLAFKVAEQAGK